MNIYLLTNEEYDENDWFNTYDSMVVVANSEEEARQIAPPERFLADKTWANSLERVTVELVGAADPKYTESGVILASFNAA